MRNQDFRTQVEDEEEEAALRVFAACGSSCLQFVVNAAIQLDLFEIIARAGDGAYVSPSDIAVQIPTTNPDAPQVLDSILRFLVAYSIITCSTSRLKNGVVERRYGLAPAGKFYVRNELGVSLAPYHALCCHERQTDLWSNLKDLVLTEGGSLFERVNGIPFYVYTSKLAADTLKMFDEAMAAQSTLTLTRILDIYDGFEGLRSLVNVGGGNGATLHMIVAKYPSLRCINFDLPAVVRAAPPHKGVEHIGGDMFVQVPKGDAILLKFVLHNWNDEQCLKLLGNCKEALEEKGKLIVMDAILPDDPQDDIHSKFASQLNLIMMVKFGGKERTHSEFQALAYAAGFAEFKVVACAYGTWIMEFLK